MPAPLRTRTSYNIFVRRTSTRTGGKEGVETNVDEKAAVIVLACLVRLLRYSRIKFGKTSTYLYVYNSMRKPAARLLLVYDILIDE
jgi:hypothetical protein